MNYKLDCLKGIKKCNNLCKFDQNKSKNKSKKLFIKSYILRDIILNDN